MVYAEPRAVVLHMGLLLVVVLVVVVHYTMVTVSLHLIQLLDVPAVVAIQMLHYMLHNLIDCLFDAMPTVGCANDVNGLTCGPGCLLQYECSVILHVNVVGGVPVCGTEDIVARLVVPDGTLGADEMIAIDFPVEFQSGKTLFVVESVLVDWVGFVGFVIPHHGGQNPVGLHWFGWLHEH
eukprot:1930941-Ditylum_brightwellii.AAC.1